MSQEATIRRGVRNARYATIPNHVFEDSRLSMEARWLLSYLLSKPDNWTVVIGDIIKKGNCGRDKARGMIAELVKFGYAEREQQRADGKFGSSVLVIFDEPSFMTDDPQSGANLGVTESVTFLPQTVLPATAEPAPAAPSPAKPALSNNSVLENTDIQDSKKSACEDLEESLADDGKRQKAIEKAYWNLIRQWPNLDGLPKDGWLKAWFELTDAERLDAERGFAGWLSLLERGGKGGKHTPRPSTYFAKKLWLEVPAKPAEPAKPELVRPFGKAGMAARFAEMVKPAAHGMPPAPATVMRIIEAGGPAAEREIVMRLERYGRPKLYAINEKSAAGEGIVVSSAVGALGSDFVSIDLKGPVGQAWRRLFERMRLPWLRGVTDYAHFPPIDPNAADLDAAVANAFWGFKERIEGNVHAAAE